MNNALQALEEKIKNTRSRKGKNKLIQLYERCNEVYGDISTLELELIWYIRQSKEYRTHTYFLVAKKIYEANLAFRELFEAAKKSDIDKL